MGRYIARRILIAVPVFLLVTIIVFAFMRLSPGEPEVIALTREISPSQAEELRRELNLHRSVPVQYGYWITDFVRGDLGRSDLHEFRVGNEIRNRLPNTLKLAALAILTALVVGIPIGILSAVKADRLQDYAFRGAAVLALSVPSFWLAILAITVPANLWGIGPPLRFTPWSVDPWSHFNFFLLPGILLGLYLVGITLRMTRAMMLEVLTSDYIRTAPRQGAARGADTRKARAPKRPDPDHHDHRRAGGMACRRVGDHRDDLQHPRHRRDDVRRGLVQGLPGRAGRDGLSWRLSFSRSTSSSTSPTASSIPGYGWARDGKASGIGDAQRARPPCAVGDAGGHVRKKEAARRGRRGRAPRFIGNRGLRGPDRHA